MSRHMGGNLKISRRGLQPVKIHVILENYGKNFVMERTYPPVARGGGGGGGGEAILKK